MFTKYLIFLILTSQCLISLCGSLTADSLIFNGTSSVDRHIKLPALFAELHNYHKGNCHDEKSLFENFDKNSATDFRRFLIEYFDRNNAKQPYDHSTDTITSALEAANILNNIYQLYSSKVIAVNNETLLAMASNIFQSSESIIRVQLRLPTESRSALVEVSEDGEFSSFIFSNKQLLNQKRRTMKKKIIMNDKMAAIHKDSWYPTLVTQQVYEQSRRYRRNIIGDFIVETSPSNIIWTLPKTVCSSKYREIKTDKNFLRKDTMSSRLRYFMSNAVIPFYRKKSSSTSEIQLLGVIIIDIDLMNIDINQCTNDSSNFFYQTNQCDNVTMSCRFQKGFGFKLGGYNCVCRPGFFALNAKNAEADYEKFSSTSSKSRILLKDDSIVTRTQYLGERLEKVFFDCVTGINDLSSCHKNSPNFKCEVCNKIIFDKHRSELLRKYVPLEAGEQTELLWQNSCVIYNEKINQQYPIRMHPPLIVPLLIWTIFCILLNLLLILCVFLFRRHVVIRNSMWTLLEIILFGCLFLYTELILRHFDPNDYICFLLPWLREIGFTLIFGTFILKLYKLISEFQSRRAHRVWLKDKDIIRTLSVILLGVCGYMTAWSAITIDIYLHPLNDSPNYDKFWTTWPRRSKILLDFGTEWKTAFNFFICRTGSWAIVLHIYEMVMEAVGFYFLYCTRSAPQERIWPNERRHIQILLIIDVFFSNIVAVSNFLVTSTIHPNITLIINFVHVQFRVTSILCLLFGSKMWFIVRKCWSEDAKHRMTSFSEMGNEITEKLFGEVNGYVDGENNVKNMKPEEFLRELARIYSQFEVIRAQLVRQSNPHLPKEKERGDRERNESKRNKAVAQAMANVRRMRRRFSNQLNVDRHDNSVVDSVNVGAVTADNPNVRQSLSNSSISSSDCIVQGKSFTNAPTTQKSQID
ncbi:hypothetical protein SNEBB_007117 [Seison nebaliae]|nr:hypothetical protein SNEBB_007117 [Seison nebaliae]